MVYTSQPQGASKRILDVGTTNQSEPMEYPPLLDPGLLEAAQQIYRDYYEVHPEQIQRPIGIAIDRFTYRGYLLFTRKPVLLPQECFIPIEQVETALQ